MCDAKHTPSAALLEWYDLHARALPWRVPPGQIRAGRRPDPYRVWLSEVMLQQTTVQAVIGYFGRFTRRWPDVRALAAAEEAEVMAEWAGLGYYARARNLVACARVVARDHGGIFPRDRDALRALPGIGEYTSAAIAAIAFGAAETVVDGNVERVVARLARIDTPLPAAKPAIRAHAGRLTPKERAGDFAQAMMDLGATTCTPRAPRCHICPLAAHCAARAAGDAATLPRRAPRTPRPVRHGIAYLARRADGAWLLERRPPRGLLGATLGWPGSAWHEAGAPSCGEVVAGGESATGRQEFRGPSSHPDAPVTARWRLLEEHVRHVFTHFELRLKIAVAHVGHGAQPTRGGFMSAGSFDPAALPSVMRKAHALAEPALSAIADGADSPSDARELERSG